jgi:hypothetical protein
MLQLNNFCKDCIIKISATRSQITAFWMKLSVCITVVLHDTIWKEVTFLLIWLWHNIWL